ncbi:MAG: primosomal protein N' [Actinomycetota bacterium]
MSSSASVAKGTEPLVIAGVLPLVSAWRVDKEFDYTCDGLDVAPGMVVQVPFGGRSVRGVVTSVRSGTSDRELQAIKKIVVGTSIAKPPLDRFFDWLAARYMVPRARVYERAVPPRVRAKVTETRTGSETSSPSLLGRFENGPGLIAAITARRSGTWCIRPPWGSDRAGIVAELVGAVGDGAALVTVPEVAYGSAVADALTLRWPDAVRVDSAQEPMDRSRALLALADGARVGIGGRATVFAPSPDVALIVVDDEHERSYKEDRTPRVDARVALMERSRLQGSVCVLISAHPRVEIGYGAASGSIGYVHCDRATERAARPHVEFVEKPRDGAVSHLLHRRVKETLDAGARVGLLVPARGYARALWCSSCRRSVRCPRCETGMSYDRSGRSVDCPRCGLQMPPPDRCPNCGSTELRFLGVGSERLEEQIAKAFPRATVVRVDPATIDDKLDTTNADIYVTTWIGTKPAIRPNVEMVGLIDADAILRRPDFRASEHAYQAFSEMAEWAGPADAGGRLVVQTDDPGHHALQAIARADYGFFLRHEIEARKDLGYPPFSELITVRASAASSAGLAAAAEICTKLEARVMGPVPDAEGGGSLIAKCHDAQEAALAMRELASSPEGRELSFDVDPR